MMLKLRSNRKGSLKLVAAIVAVIVLVALVALAVYYYSAYHNLGFQLNSVSLGSVSTSVLTLNFAIDVNNTNLLPIYIPSGSFDIYVNDQYLGKGTFNSLTVEGSSVGQIKAPVTFNVSDVPAVAAGILGGGGTVTVTIEGSADLWLLRVPFSSTLYDAKLI
ncbi:MAG: LEA type 2 family protein [Candidatus Bathyarchaeota archaeon]|nr:LEA type 2 family protein [Candidatus Bathyarchaeota archaeon]